MDRAPAAVARKSSAVRPVSRDWSKAPPLRFITMLFYGLGSASNGIKNRSITTFLLLFYSQVVGLPATWVGSALAITLIFDGLLDPVIGQVSDNFRSKWGRRHPFIYFSAIPYAAIFVLLWTPPAGWSPGALLAYMTVCVVLLRSIDTFFEVPASAMSAELTPDYHQRTTLIACRYFFTFAGGLTMIWMAYRFFFNEASGGLFVRDSYSTYALVAATVIALSILACGMGTHHRIPWLRQPPQRKLTIKLLFVELAQTLANRSLWLANAAGLFTAIASGMIGGLAIYFQVYFWELTPRQLSYLPVAGMAAAFLGILLGPRITRQLGKKRGGIAMFAALMLVSITPVSLRLVDIMPPNGSSILFYILVIESLLIAMLTLMTAMAITSMIADVAEDSEVKTGRRSEGLLFSIDNVLKKSTAGAGVFVASLILSAAGISGQVRPGEISEAALHEMGLIFVPAIIFIYGGAILSLLVFPLDEQTHKSNLETLRNRGDAEALD
jgi:GPH family glycoside/pentoside/hexuronide:cation symporter